MPPELAIAQRDAGDGPNDSGCPNVSLDELLAVMRWMAKRRLQRLPPDFTLQTTALINETWIRLYQSGVMTNSPNARYLYGSVARSIRDALSNAVRQRMALKRGGRGMTRQPLREEQLVDESLPTDLIDLDDGIKALKARSPRAAEVVDLKYFAGLTVDEIAGLLGVSKSTVDADWRFARDYLYRFMK